MLVFIQQFRFSEKGNLILAIMVTAYTFCIYRVTIITTDAEQKN